MMTRKQATGLLQTTYESWSSHNAPRLGAALSFYMLLSMAPLLILLVSICGLVFTENGARQQIMEQVQAVAGPAGEKSVQMLIENAREPRSGVLATIVAFVTLLMGASGVFIELRDALNTLWDVPKATSANVKTIVWQRLTSFGMVFALGNLVLASLVVSTGLSIAEKFFLAHIPAGTAFIGQLADVGVSLVAMTILFAFVYKFVPDVPIDWRDVGIGAIATAVLFTVGRALLGLYLVKVGVGSTYGAAGSLVAFIVWAYYSAQIFFFGAAFTRAYATCFGSVAERRGREEKRRLLKGNSVARRQNA